MMPELPEVETIARDLERRILGRRVRGIELSGLPLRMCRPVDRDALERAAVAQFFERITRRSKYLLLEMSGGHVVLVHLGMSGRLELSPAVEPRRPHTHCVLLLDGDSELRFADPRRFGMISAHPRATLDDTPELRALGPDPLDPAFTPALLLEALRRTRGADLKSFLLDQRRIAGIGNIYASEILFASQLHPRGPAARLSSARAERLHAAIRAVLLSAVEHRGTTFRDYVDSSGRRGENSARLQVFLRERAPCPRCGAVIRRLVQAARSTFYCPRCQKR